VLIVVSFVSGTINKVKIGIRDTVAVSAKDGTTEVPLIPVGHLQVQLPWKTREEEE